MKGKKFKKFTILLMILGLSFKYLLPISNVLAAEPSDKSGFGVISIHNLTSLEDKSNTNEIIATFEHGTVRFSGAGMYSDGTNTIYASGNVSADCTPDSSYTCEILSNGTNTHGSTLNINDLNGTSGVVNFDASFNAQTQGESTTSTITVSAGEGTYNITRKNPNTGEDIVQTVDYDDMINLRVNGEFWDPEKPTVTYISNEDTVVITFETLWINRYYDDIVINNQSYPVSNYINFDNRESWLIHNNGTQIISFSITNVPKSNAYDIVVKHGENNGTRFISTFLWTGDPSQSLGHDYIGNAKLEFVKATYEVGGVTYTVTENDIKGNTSVEGDHLVFRSDDGFLNYGVLKDVDFDDGSLTLPGESEVTMRVVPNYGYQVTSVNGGSNFTTTDEGISEFTVTLHNGEAGYFQAEVTKVDDEVIANSEKIKSGEITISSDEIDAGTVQLSVDDADIDETKIKDFEKAAGDYSIKNYLDINLNQVLYRGTEDSVWTNQIHHLDNEATISLKLEEGIDVNDIVIVHNIDDGEEFEIIKIESYDPETRIITFKTKSFSNYAIATKASTSTNTSSSTTSSNPKTGDNIINYVIMLLLSLGALIVIYTKKKKNY